MISESCENSKDLSSVYKRRQQNYLLYINIRSMFNSEGYTYYKTEFYQGRSMNWNVEFGWRKLSQLLKIIGLSMKLYLTKQAAICGLHERGYYYDFQIMGNDLYWVQEKLFVRAEEFTIKEYYQFTDRSKNGTGIIIFGIAALYHNVKGILIRRYFNNSLKTPPVVLKKLGDLFICSPKLVPTIII